MTRSSPKRTGLRQPLPLVLPDEFVDALEANLHKYRAPKAPARRGRVTPAGRALLNQFVWGDPHIGMLSHARETGANFDLKIAVRDLRASADALLAKVPAARSAVFCEVGDLWHAQDDMQATPRGQNKLDVDGRKSKILEVGLSCTRYMIDRLLEHHDDVTVVLVPGNHDPDLALSTRLWLAAVYEKSGARVHIIDNADPYLYHVWGDNMWLYTHGDKRVKPQEYGELMLRDRPKETGAATHRRAFTGHIHHKQVAEFRWGRWESFNSLCASDFWHHGQGYRSERLVEAITTHERFGEHGRVRVTHQELEAARA